MRKCLLTILLFLNGAVTAGNFLSADLNRDGKTERLFWIKAGEDEMGTYYLLEVQDDSGKVLWRSKASKEPNDPFYVAETDFGVSLPELLEDIDGDGASELIIPEPQSDISPTRYHRLKWRNGRFEAMPPAYLAYFPSGNGGTVRWVRNVPEPFGRWVSELKRGGNSRDGHRIHRYLSSRRYTGGDRKGGSLRCGGTAMDKKRRKDPAVDRTATSFR